MRILPSIAVLLACSVAAVAADTPPQTVRTFFIGNSVTDTVKYGLLAKLAEARGKAMPWGRHMIPGAPLYGMLENSEKAVKENLAKAPGFTEERYGHVLKAFAEHEWDAVTLQPFDRQLTPREGDKDGWQADRPTIQRHLAPLFAKSPQARVFIYARWPRITVNGKDAGYSKDAYDQNVRGISPVAGTKPPVIDDFLERYARPYTGKWDLSNETEDYFKKVLAAAREDHPQQAERILLIPVGPVMAEVERRARKGEVPGITGVFKDLYADGIHLNPTGSYLCAVTFYACLFRESPVGLPHDLYQVPDAKTARALEAIAWEVVTKEPLTGVTSTK